MRILVTGGAGFIGSHLCKSLLDQGHFVTCLDNLYTGSKENIKALLSHPQFLFKQHDVVEPYDVGPVDEIYNLACPASPPHYQADPVKTLKTSVLGMLNALELAKKHHARILQASTSEVYGDPLVHPQKESYYGNVNCFGPRACYDEGKRAAETLCFDYHKKHGVDIRIIRIFNTYGPNMHPEDGRVVSNFIIQALQGKPLTIYGDGNQTRSFCYVSDLVAGMQKLMASTLTEPTNIGNPGEFTIKQLAEKIIEKTGSSSKLSYHPLPVNDPLQRKPDITKAKTHLHWEPAVALDQGLDLTIPYFKKRLGL